ncbi:MAG TPA: DUF547 domain-containing protein [Thermoanaerobaculia bacterium]
MNRTCIWVAIGFLASGATRAAPPDPAPLDAVLAARAKNGGFDYRGTDGQDKKRLSAYLANVGDAQPASMSADERKAFYINAYNVIAIETILENPGKKIIDVDGAFKAAKHRIGGEMLTLDDIENKLRELKDARIHFAIVCASKSCPPLASKAYRAEGLSAALDRQGREFVNDVGKNRIDKGRNQIALSMIFNWNRKEFERDGGSLLKYVSRFVADPAAAAWLGASTKEPEFLEYDWSPNQP